MQFQTITPNKNLYLYRVESTNNNNNVLNGLKLFICHSTGETQTDQPFVVAVGPRAVSPWSSNLVSILSEVYPEWQVRRIERYQCFDHDPNQIDELVNHKLYNDLETINEATLKDSIIPIKNLRDYNRRRGLNMDEDELYNDLETINEATLKDSIIPIKNLRDYNRRRGLNMDEDELYNDLETINEATLKDSIIPIKNLRDYNRRRGLNMDEDDICFYEQLFTKLHRNPTTAEIHDLANCNSEHSRHHIFRGIYQVSVPTEYGMAYATLPESPMDLVKKTLSQASNQSTSVVAFCDNASAIRGPVEPSIVLLPNMVGEPCKLEPFPINMHTTFTAETHNFPTAIAPFQGATTGTGGRIRDTQAIGQGGLFVAGTCGYCVGQIEPKTLAVDDRYYNRWSPVDILLQASDGASDYGNKVGEPVIQGFTRSFGTTTAAGKRIEWLKPIMFSGGIGKVFAKQAHKSPVNGEYMIARVGGPTYRLGINGGAASSGSVGGSVKLLAAVQRGDAQMENRMDRWLRACISLAHHLDRPFIHSIHDQGAGGMGNVTKEIVDGFGAIVCIDDVTLGDPTLSNTEIWTAESQEQNTVLLRSQDVTKAMEIAKRERVNLEIIGRTKDTGTIQVVSKLTNTMCVDLPLKGIDPPRKKFIIPNNKIDEFLPKTNTFENSSISQILSSIDVGSKRFLTTKVDRSVGGLIAQQQCVGPLQTPLSNVAVIADSFIGFKGAATAIGEHSLDYERIEDSVRWAICEMLTNLVWAPITAFDDIRCSGNWMWPAQTPEGKGLLYRAVQAVSRDLITLGIAIDGGKDSVSMSAVVEKTGQRVDSPPTFVISGYVGCTDIRKIVTPGFKRKGSYIWGIPVSLDSIKNTFIELQKLIEQGVILAGHDGDEFTVVLLEMCFAAEGRFGVTLDPFDGCLSKASRIILVEVQRRFDLQHTLPLANHVGIVQDEYLIQYDKMSWDISTFRHAWELTATALEKRQTVPEMAQAEHDWLVSGSSCEWENWFVPQNLNLITSPDGYQNNASNPRPKACVMRGEGSNGDKEMCAALWAAGFEAHDVTTSDITDGRLQNLDAFKLLVFVGGFTYSDVLGAGVGWAAILKKSKVLTDFIKRDDTLVLGVCNGFQLLAELGWISGKLTQNKSKRFESRFVQVKISDTNTSPWFNNIRGMNHGIWIAHGQGQYISGHDDIAAIYYIDEDQCPTESYPQNPNGSPSGIAAVTANGGRILGMMPHPERCFRSWQLAWSPTDIDWASTNYNTGWLAMFRNAYNFCANNE
jgi:phosphoribosylformylglycinamidine synthase